MEEIGKVKLDYSKYSGRDLYCDGEVEDELLNLVRQKSSAEYGKVIEERKSWPILYHLSPLRENIIEWIPMDDIAPKPAGAGIPGSGAKVLEVGSGCGAITGALAGKARSVTCVELSKKRSLINAHRHRECGNVTIHVGNFKDIEPGLPRDFDFIFLIGVFEYAQSYMGGDSPYEDFLKSLLPHLAEGGRLLIAIENQYGLKYFAGCKEDHLGTYFSGIENYEAGGGVRTFSRQGLERIFRSCGAEEYHFYYPYPDYKFMTSLYSDDYLPRKGELSNNLRNFDRDRMLLFDEKHAFDGLTEDGLFPVFTNSYLVVIGREFNTKYVKYSNDRAPEYAIRTEIVMERGFRAGRQRVLPRAGSVPVAVRKYPMSQAAAEHVRGMEAAYESLAERYQGGSLEINRCRLVEEGDQVCAQFEFVPGVLLSELMDQRLEQNDLPGFYKYYRQFIERIGYNSEYPAADFDPGFSNILIQKDDETSEEKWTLIDYEWTFGRPIDTKELAFRAIYCYLLEDAGRSRLKPELVLKELSITEETAEKYRQQEREFQQFVTGERAAMAQIREKIGCRVMVPQKWIDRYQDSEQVSRVQIYEDRGDGYSEEKSYFVPEAYQGEQLIVLGLKVDGDVENLRIDPGLSPCAVKIMEMTFNGDAVPLEKKKVLSANGRIVKPSDKNAVVYCPSIVFATDDPGISIRLGGLKRRKENTMQVRMEIVRLPMAVAQDLADAKRKGLF